ncbi:MAG: hypothetical protein Q9178_002236 [Gyalolechia marmorata]
MTSATQLPHALIETIAGFLAGVASTLVAHPLDVLKTRLQVDRSSSSQAGTSLRLVQGILKNEGVANGLYRGLSPNLAGNSISWALYFLWYSEIKAGLQAYHASANGHGTQQIYRAEGVRGFYRGLLPSLIGVSHGALQFMAYEQLKRYRASQLAGSGADLGTVDYLWLSGASKVLAGSITYPYQVVRSRLQMYEAEQTYKGARDAIAQTWKQEGPWGFYKGLGPNLVRVLPSTWITFLVYEKAKGFMPRIFG